MDEEIFLTKDQVIQLTGRRSPRKQIEALRSMTIPFFVNSQGRPIIALTTIIGNKKGDQNFKKEKWAPGLSR